MPPVIRLPLFSALVGIVTTETVVVIFHAQSMQFRFLEVDFLTVSMCVVPRKNFPPCSAQTQYQHQ